MVVLLFWFPIFGGKTIEGELNLDYHIGHPTPHPPTHNYAQGKPRLPGF